MALLAPLTASVTLARIAITSAIMLTGSLLFIKTKSLENKLLNNTKTSKDKLRKSALDFNFPSVTKIILLFVTLNWLTSFGSLLAPTNTAYSFAMHDALLVLSIYNISSWIKQRMQTLTLPHNHSLTVIHIDKDNKQREIPIAQLKKGMHILINKEALIPINCTAIQSCTITSDASESMLNIEPGTKINANTICHSGLIKCEENYQPVQHSKHIKESEDNDIQLSIFLVTFLSIALISGLYTGIIAASINLGLQKFCLNLIVACPCVFFISKPIINNKFLEWLGNKSKIMFNKLPTRGQPNKLIFDRTNTIYVPDPDNPEGPYILNSGILELLKKLKSNNIECYILSGHGTSSKQRDWQTNLANCIQELDGVIKKENIIFNKKYHDPQQAEKKKIIENLQLYGQITKPKSMLTLLYYRLKSIFTTNKVGMIGDGNNDIEAMKQADFTVAVAKSKNNFNTGVLKEANFCSEQKDLHELSGVIQGYTQSHFYNQIFIISAFAYNITMLTMVNGMSTYLFATTLSPAIACLAVSAFCITLSLSASLLKINYKKIDKLQLQKKCCHDPLCTKHKSNMLPKTPIIRQHSKCTLEGCTSKKCTGRRY